MQPLQTVLVQFGILALYSTCTAGNATPSTVQYLHSWECNSFYSTVLAQLGMQLLLQYSTCTAGNATPLLAHLHSIESMEVIRHVVVNDISC